LSTTYSTVKGDTFEIISRKVYGYESDAVLIRNANPGIFEPIPAGVDLVIPTMTLTRPQPVDYTSGVDETALTILGVRYRFWDSITLKRSIDSVDTLELTAPFDPEDEDFRRYFRPFSYPQVTLSIGGELVFTGTQITVKPTNSTSGRAVSAASYSLPGVLEDCCAPASMYAADEDTLEFENSDIRTIATKLLKPFGLKAVFEAPAGAPFELVSIKATEAIMPFLAKMARHRALVITSNTKGEVVFWQSDPGGHSVAQLRDDVGGPMVSIDPDFRSQEYYSHITGLESSSTGGDGGQYTVTNKRLKGVLRPYTFEVSDNESDEVELTTATEGKIGRMFGNSVSYSVVVNTWRDSKGKLWSPNTTVIVHAPSVMIYKPYEFLIKDVEYRRTSNSAEATLTLVLPDSYRGKIPRSMPWDS
jgi:prophage tail gpP-like protein/phage tail protein X